MEKCKLINTNIVKELEFCKDIVWYLKGQIDLAKKEDLYGYPFGNEHIQALESMVSFIMEVKNDK